MQIHRLRQSIQVGDGTIIDKLMPTIIDSGVLYSEIIVNRTACALTALNVLKCWGYNIYGQVGDGTNINKTIPTVIDSGTSYTQIITNGSSCGITSTGTLKCWGQNDAGQVGNGTTVDKYFPVIIDSGVAYQNITIRSSTTYAQTKYTNEIKSWGANSFGQMGDSTINDYFRYFPRIIMNWLN